MKRGYLILFVCFIFASCKDDEVTTTFHGSATWDSDNAPARNTDCILAIR
jgi:hypothetical protein